MFELLLITVITLPLIVAANLATKQQRLAPRLTILTLGPTKASRPWRLVAIAVQRLSFGETPAFNPNKPVHRFAALLMLLGFAITFALIAADDAADQEIALSDATIELIGSGALHLAAAFLGVGWLTRRRLSDVLRRLSLRRPTLREAGLSIAIGVGLWLFSIAAVAVWEQAVPADVFQTQTQSARLYFNIFSDSFVAAIMLAIVPALSEEIFYRGALQPVFGVLLSSLFFTATHLQYALTPAMLILFAVSLGFAWLRLRYHTSAAIIAHAVFNFLPFLTAT